MNEQHFKERAIQILINMSLEKKGFWRQFFGRWHISDEPLRHDAANLLNEYGITTLIPKGCQRVGDDNRKGERCD